MKAFIEENYIDALMEHPNIQQHFAQWLKTRKTHASKETQKGELRHLHRMASKFSELATLENEIEKQRIDSHNNVARTSIKVSISRVIDEQFLKRMQAQINSESERITKTMIYGFVVFSATLMTGVRPHEWWSAQLFRERQNPECQLDHPTLHVVTGKTKPYQQQQTRNLVLEGFGDAQLDMIQHAIEIVQPMSKVQHGYLSNGLRRLASMTAQNEEEKAVVKQLDIGAARKLYAVEALRDSRSQRQVAGALGHTSDGNLRHYSEGDIYCSRMMRYPLARITEEAEGQIKEHLKKFLDSRYADKASPEHNDSPNQ